MKRCFLTNIFLLLYLYGVHLFGQGNISGMIIDSLTQTTIDGVIINLSGTFLTSVSDINGEFTIPLVPPWDYILTTSNLGYKEKRNLISIKSDETISLKIQLQTSTETILSDQAKYQAEEISLQSTSDNIKNVISGNKMNFLPYEDLHLALRHLPGVSLKHSSDFFLPKINYSGNSFDGTTGGDIFPPLDDFPITREPVTSILIRGMNSKYSNITLNGIRIPHTSKADKNTDLSLFSSNAFKMIELDKTITSDKDADVWIFKFQTQFDGDLGQVSINTFFKNIDRLQLPTYWLYLTSVNAIESFKSLGTNWESFPVDNPFRNNNSLNLYTFYNPTKPGIN